MVLRCAHLSDEHVSEHTHRLDKWARSGHMKSPMHDLEEDNVLKNMGWLTGLEPATTGITIQNNTNSLFFETQEIL